MKVRHVGLAVGLVTALLLATAPPAALAAGPPSRAPVVWTPSLATSGTDGSVEQVRQLVPCGSMMYAVGTFTAIRQGGVTYARNNAFAFNAATGALSGWNPNVNGRVNSVALTSNCATAYLGGAFTHAGGTTAKNIVSVNTSTGAANAGFSGTANGQVSALLVSGAHLLAGGYFTSINGSARGYLASLNLGTGADDGYVNLHISGTYSYNDQNGNPAQPNPTRVYNFALNPARNRLLAMGVFTSVGGLARRQIFMLSLNATNTVVHPWYSTEFNQNCAAAEPFWLQDASFAPDGSKIYIATTGYKPASGPGFTTTSPRAGLCDVAAAFPTIAGPVSHLWVNYTGCDSLYATAADSSTAYFGGHERWASNSVGCDQAGAGAVDAPGMVGLAPASGAVSYNPTRGRGLGADDMVVTSRGLWIASDNLNNTNDCGGAFGHAGICFLPYKTKPHADFNGDGKADRAVWRPSTGMWVGEGNAPTAYGQSGDRPQAGDFTGDGKSDLAIFRPSTGQWFVKNMTTVAYGNSADRTVAADYNGDGRFDIAVWRPSNGTWNVRGQAGVAFGVSSDVPVTGDFTGDGRADFTIWRPSNGGWYVRGLAPVAFGQAGDRPLSADFTGDGRADIAVWRPSNGTWYVRGASPIQWGMSGDIPVAGDFTGDGKADIAVWRPSNGTWYVRNVNSLVLGQSGDIPLS
ncbi:MAG: VCBS repeat-containing protein [Mycobacteriales bacterium]